jgi:hypothetical protein
MGEGERSGGKFLSEEELKTCLDAIDSLSLVFESYGHEWTERERRLYERAVRILGGE